MRKLEKSLLWIGVLIGLLFSLSIAASAEIRDQGTDGNLSWRIESSEEYEWVMYLTGSGPMRDHTYDCGDASWARSPYLYLVKRIEIGDGITHIGNHAFHFRGGAVQLSAESVYIPDTVTSIGDSAFSDCFYLRRINIPSSVRTIGEYAFYRCSNLEKVTLNAGLQSIGRWAFAKCIRMPAPSIPSSVKSIGADAFSDCSFGRIVIPAGVTSIGDRAFGYSSGKPVSDFVIQGTAGSQAEIYAKNSGLLFTTSSGAIPRPTVTAENIGLGSVRISWTGVPGAAGYEVCYKEGSSGSTPWKVLGTTSGTSYDWSGAKERMSYSFTVRATDGAGNPVSPYGTAAALVAFGAPPAVTVSQLSSGVRISWKEPYQSSQNEYRILCKTGSGSWEKLADVRGSSYIWTGAKGGTTYSFTVRMIFEDDYRSALDDTGVTITVKADEKQPGGSGQEGSSGAGATLAAPRLSGVRNVKNGVKITWQKVSGAEKYRVFYKKGSGEWKKLKDTASAGYTWKKAKSGARYSFVVCCVSGDGKNVVSAYSETSEEIVCLAMPKLSSAKKSGNGIKVKWKKTKGAEEYIVYRRTAKESWKQLGKTTSVSYTDKKAAKGTVYYYTVCARAGSVKSAYDSSGISGKR